MLLNAVASRGGAEGAERPGWHHLKGWHQTEENANLQTRQSRACFKKQPIKGKESEQSTTRERGWWQLY